jgi:hypothetical protein
VVFAKEFEDFLWLGGLGEGGIATQVTKHDDDLAAMAFQDLLVTLRDDQLGQLRREEALQTPDPAQLLDLAVTGRCFSQSSTRPPSSREAGHVSTKDHRTPNFPTPARRLQFSQGVRHPGCAACPSPRGRQRWLASLT